MKSFILQPRDLLFFRDARPMSGSSEGAGATWPLPSVLHSALLSAFHERWPDGTEWESGHKHFAPREQTKFDKGVNTTMRFGGLHTIGPFPRLHGNGRKTASENALPSGIYLPTPADVVPQGIMQPVAPLGDHNLPAPLRYAVASSVPPSKENVYPWLSADAFRRYLAGDVVSGDTVSADALYVCEARPGVGIDPETHANRQSVFYQAEYLRLRPDVSLTFLAQAEAKKYGESSGVDLFEQFFADGDMQPLILGGQRGLATLREGAFADELDFPAPSESNRKIKWVLLTPALFNNGWRPDWVDEEGRVKLKELPDRAGYPTRKAWREAAKNAPPIAARLVAARMPKALAVSGWKLRVKDGTRPGGPKPTRLLVPAGAVYYFECQDEAAAASLVRQLHGKVKSQRLGEQGFGFGVCGTWDVLKVDVTQ